MTLLDKLVLVVAFVLLLGANFIGIFFISSLFLTKVIFFWNILCSVGIVSFLYWVKTGKKTDKEILAEINKK